MQLELLWSELCETPREEAKSKRHGGYGDKEGREIATLLPGYSSEL